MNTVANSYTHHQSAHCESGVTSNLLKGIGLDISEAMSFGLGSGIFFLHMPFVKVMGLPLTSYRSFPGSIFKKTCKRLGITYDYQSFRDPLAGTRTLDSLLSQHPVGIRTNIFWLPYIPEKFRFQFNAHNLVVLARETDGNYLVSDPIIETTSACSSQAMTKARFSKGPLAPKGLLFYPNVPTTTHELPWNQAIRQAIRETTNSMLFSPVPFVGVRGIRYLGRKMAKWPKSMKDASTIKLNVANIVRMQEEIGTGGAGFRYLYSAFLQEAGDRLNHQVLKDCSRAMTDAGNEWRQFATLAAKFCKDRLETSYSEMPQLLDSIANHEKMIYQNLRRHYL